MSSATARARSAGLAPTYWAAVWAATAMTVSTRALTGLLTARIAPRGQPQPRRVEVIERRVVVRHQHVSGVGQTHQHLRQDDARALPRADDTAPSAMARVTVARSASSGVARAASAAARIVNSMLLPVSESGIGKTFRSLISPRSSSRPATRVGPVATTCGFTEATGVGPGSSSAHLSICWLSVGGHVGRRRVV